MSEDSRKVDLHNPHRTPEVRDKKAMYVRRRVVKGNVYFQIVEGVREGPRVRQRIVLSLGREANPPVVLKKWRRFLIELQGYRDRVARSGSFHSDRSKAHALERIGARIAKLESRIARLAELILARKIGAASKRKGG
jgi:hypothetical protein